MARGVTALLGACAVALGGLWLLQGLGLARLRPILCFVDCAGIQCPSATWAIIGALTLIVGALAMVWALRR